MAGFAEVRLGNLENARGHVDYLQKHMEPQMPALSQWRHPLEGEIALAEGDLTSAEAAFTSGQPPRKVWLSFTNFTFGVFLNHSPFRDGLARTRKSRGDLSGAIEIYRKLLTPDISNPWTSMLEPRYVLELARLLDQSGDEAGAREEYRRFVELWKNADPGLPELDEARAYLAK
jgi:tetratricopeptide (TPR) repeat protein